MSHPNRNFFIAPMMLSDMEPLVKAAAEDGHGVAAPSHVVFKDREIVGYLSVGIVPTILLWLHSKKVNVHNTLEAVNYYEDYLKTRNVVGYLLPVPQSSPLHPYVERDKNYLLASPNTTMFFKQLPQPAQPEQHRHKGGD